MYRASLVLLVLFTFSNNCHAQSIWHFEDSLHRFEIKWDTVFHENKYWSYGIKELEISRKKDSFIIARFDPNAIWIDSYLGKEQAFRLEDVNFDGYNDFGVLAGQTARMERVYTFWIYRPNYALFQQDTVLSQLWNPNFNAEKKLVHEWTRVGCCYIEHSLYHWNADVLKLIATQKDEANPDISDKIYRTTEVQVKPDHFKTEKIVLGKYERSMFSEYCIEVDKCNLLKSIAK